MPRFAILAHDHPFPHWDFFLEVGEVLRSWRLLASLEPGVPVTAEVIGEHRLIYLDYEGPVSNGRGRVQRIDRGTFTWLSDDAGDVVVQLSGQVYQGRLTLAAGKAMFEASGGP